MKIRLPNITKVQAFVRKKEEARERNAREVAFSRMSDPNLSPVYKDRGSHSALEFGLKKPGSKGSTKKNWAWFDDIQRRERRF